jgi:hypothetical protein
MLDVSKHTYTSDFWEYFYIGNSSKIDSVIRHLTIEGFPPSRKCERYSYQRDSVIVRSVSIAKEKGDTLSNWLDIYTDSFKSQESMNLRTNGVYYLKFNDWGCKLLDMSKYPGEDQPSGQKFILTTCKEYIEAVEYYKGVIDSNNIRRYYFTDFDSVIADYLVERQKEPIILKLNMYNTNNKLRVSYGFGMFSNFNVVEDFDYNTYTSKGQIHRKYLFRVKNPSAKEKEYRLVNYTEYEYDKLGRKTKMTTRVVPDPKYQRQEKK